MIRLSLVTVVEKPDVANVEDLVLAFTEESREVLCGLSDLRQPDHSWEVDLTTLHEVSLQFDGVGAAGNGGLCKITSVSIDCIVFKTYWQSFLREG